MGGISNALNFRNQIKWELPPRHAQIWQADLRMIESNMNENGGKFVNPSGETVVVT